MKWFKHAVDAHNGRTIQKILKKYGLEGEARYWRLIAICSQKFVKKGEKIAFDPDFVRRSLRHRSVTDTRPFVDWLATGGIIIADLSGDDWLIEIPNILEIRDNHSRNLQVTDKQLHSNLDLDTDKDKELDVDVEIAEKNLSKLITLKTDSTKSFDDAFKYAEWISFLKNNFIFNTDLKRNIGHVAARFETLDGLKEFCESVLTSKHAAGKDKLQSRRYLVGAIMKESELR